MRISNPGGFPMGWETCLKECGGKTLGVNRQRLFFSMCVFTLGNSFCACGGGSSHSEALSAPTVAITPTTAILLSGQSVQFSATEGNRSLVNPTWMVNGLAGGSAALGTITSSGLYTASASASASTTAVQVTVIDGISKAISNPAQVSLVSPTQFVAGTVSSSNNPQVAQYTFQAPQGTSVQVQFGTSTNYGLTTWVQDAPAAGGTVTVLVAGMRANTTYHMQAIVHLPSGQQVMDADHAFTTGDLPAALIPDISVSQPGGGSVASGVELLDLFQAPKNQLTALATDVDGNVIWYYKMNPGELPFPIKLLPNGHMLIVSAIDTTLVSPPTTASNEVREIDLAGNVIYRLSLIDIAQGLTSIGNSFQSLGSLHHDILKLPNGHLICLVNYNPALPDGSGYLPVTGDALVDWDPQQQRPVWVWSAFDHIPLTHAPYSTVDWTHANAVIYSPDDGNLILSMRNQNWIVKINYQDGAGDGSILWRLGPDGDFSLPSGQAPIEWNYGQHYPTVASPNSAGIFQLMFFNNGNNRLVDAANDVCGTPGFIPCYSSVPVFELNEITKTAQVVSEKKLSSAYSICCGSASQLPNGDLEYDVAFDIYTPGLSFVQEVTQQATPQLVWQMNITGQLAYRAFRMPSLYPGVEWTQSAIAAANVSAVRKK
jgi:arylsulfate sulfotransferase